MNWTHPELKEKRTVLVTGAAGFVGHHLVEEIIVNTNWNIVAICRMQTIGDMNKFADMPRVVNAGDRVKFIYHDFKFAINHTVAEQIGKVDYILHLGANSHVDRSITHPVEFFHDNVIGTVNMLEFARTHFPDVRFLNFSTDEVFGPAPHGIDWKEDERYYPSNPYSGSKAGAVDAGICYYVTYKLPVITTHCMNIFGQRQNEEKLVPKSMRCVIEDKIMPIHCQLKHGVQPLYDEKGLPYSDNHDDVEYVGERHWLHVRNACNATLFILLHGVAGEKYNIVGDIELTNDAIVKLIGKEMGKEVKLRYVDFHACRPGHDRRYALDGKKLKEMGWTPPVTFEDSLKSTIEWTLNKWRSQ